MMGDQFWFWLCVLNVVSMMIGIIALVDAIRTRTWAKDHLKSREAPRD